MDQIVSVTPGDVHIIMIPSPGGPVPTPIPHPCTSIIKDKVAEKVKVMGQPGAVKGSISQHTPPHIPMGPGPFQKPPANKGEIVTASSNVFYEGKEAAMLGDTGKMCADPSDAPVGKVIGTAATVLVGGGGGGSDEAREQASAEAMKAAQAACDESKCTKAGHPVNVATGEVTAGSDDLMLPGLIPILFQRSYASTRADQLSDLGYGWKHSWDYRLLLRDDCMEYIHAGGRSLFFEVPAGNREVRLVEEGFTLRRSGEEWVVTTPTGRQLVFPALVQGLSDVRAYQLRDAFGNALAFQYDNANLLIEIRDQAGRSLLFDRQPTGQIVKLDLVDRNTTVRRTIRTFAYDEHGDLTLVIDACGNQISYRYDRHLLVQETDRNGNSWYFTYDDQRRCLETWGTNCLLYRRFKYSPNETYRTLMIDSIGCQWVYDVNADRLVTRMISPLGYTESYEWSKERQLLAKTDRNGATTGYEYDSKTGNVVVIHDPESNDWGFEYNDAGYETKFTHPDGATMVKEYDERGALVKSTDPLGATTEYEYDSRGLIQQIILPDGRVWKYKYDIYGFLSQCTDENGTYNERYRHQFTGCLVEINSATGLRTKREYDLEGHLIKQHDDEGVTFEITLDGEGNIKQYTDADGTVIRLKFDALGALIEREDLSITPGGPKRLTQYIYNGESQIVEILDPTNQSYQYLYDEDGRLIQARYPDGRVVRLGYDGKKNVVFRLNSDGSSVRTTYDQLDRAVSKELTNSDGTQSRYSYEYNADNQIVYGQKDDHVVETEFDVLGRPVRENQDGQEFSYEYDVAGRRTKIIFPGGYVVRYDYDDAARTLVIDSQLHGRISYTYDFLFRIRQSACPNGVVESFDYDRKSRIIEQKLGMGGVARYHKELIYKGGRLKEARETNGTALRLGYGGADRVVNTSIHSGERTAELNYTFDANNNLTGSPDGSRWIYGEGNRLLESPVKLLAYDPDGRVLRSDAPDGSAHYFYDAEGLLTRVEKSDHSTIKFDYDAFQRRVLKEVNGVKLRFLWDVAVPVVEQNCQRTSYNLFFPERFSPIARREIASDLTASDKCYYFHSDQIGAVQRVTAEDGGEVWSATYTPLGEALVDPASSMDHPFRTAGEYWDSEIDLGYHRKRYYDPRIGRFTTHDPKDILGGLNLYVFYRNGYEFYDPLGADSKWDYVKAWGKGYEDYLDSKVISGGSGTTSVPTGLGQRNYDNSVTNRRGTTFYEAKYIGANGMSSDAIDRARNQLSKDEEVMASNPNVKVKWIFNKDPPADLKADLDALKAQYPGQFSYEVKPTPPCFKKTYVEPHLPGG